MQSGEIVLLLGKDRYFVKPEERTFSTQYGEINLRELHEKNFGDTIKSHTGEEFFILKPSILDFLELGASRGPQVITPKDFATILSLTMPPADAKIIEAGTGSGYLTMLLASVCVNGTICTYEARKEFFTLAEKNFSAFGFKNIVAKNKDILSGIEEKGADLAVLDMEDAEKAIPLAAESLKRGGKIVIYSPYVEQAKGAVIELEKLKFSGITTVENIQREWDVRRHTLPKRQGVMHTGFVTVGRKL